MVDPHADKEDDEVAVNVGGEPPSLDLHGAPSPRLITSRTVARRACQSLSAAFLRRGRVPRRHRECPSACAAGAPSALLSGVSAGVFRKVSTMVAMGLGCVMRSR